jgi:hypothetical protein
MYAIIIEVDEEFMELAKIAPTPPYVWDNQILGL